MMRRTGAPMLRILLAASALWTAAARAGVEEDLARLSSDDFDAREAAFRSLLEAGTLDPAAVLPRLPSDPQDPDVRAACAALRKEVPLRRARWLAERIAGADEVLRAQIRPLFEPLDGGRLRSLTDLLQKKPAADEVFIWLLSHEDPEIRQLSVLALGKRPGEASARAVLSSLSDPDPKVRTTAAMMLGKRPDATGAAAGLARLLDDPSADVRSAAIGALGLLKSAEHAPRILELLEKSESQTRQAAILAIAEIAPPGAAKRLTPILSDPNEGLRLCALQALLRLKDRSALPAILARLDSAEDSERCQIVGVLGHFDDESVREALLRLMDDPSVGVRAQAIRGVGALRIAKALPRLRDKLNGKDPSDRLAAIDALGSFKDPRLVSLLIPFVEDAQMAHPALHRLGDLAGIPFILQPNAPKAAKEWWARSRDDPKYALPPELGR